MNKKRLIFVLIVIIAASLTARWWFPLLLQMLSVNGDFIQSLDALISIFSSIVTLVSALGGYLLLREDKRETETLDQRNRRIMLDHVENFWIRGILEESLYGTALVELGIKEEPGLVGKYPWGIKRETTNEILPSGMSMLEIFKQIGDGRSLLILGSPGSGKTTMLLELARQLVDLARQDGTEPIPMVFNLASWTEEQTLAGWLVKQLNLAYYIPKKTALAWVNENKLLLLLDGLDEVRSKSRIKCVEEINAFRKDHGLTSMVVCSRSQDYAELHARLDFNGAIEIQPLTPEQVAAYFTRLGNSLAGVQQLLKKDLALREMAQSPLFLSIMIMAYRDTESNKIVTSADRNVRRRQLFDEYINRMFERPQARNSHFNKKDVLHWLTWLASKMIKHDQIPYQLERMQPDWLDDSLNLSLFRLVAGSLTGLVAGLMVMLLFTLVLGLVPGLGARLGIELPLGLNGKILIVLVVVFFYSIAVGLDRDPIDVSSEGIETVEALGWSWMVAGRALSSGLGCLLLFGLPLVLLGRWYFGVHPLQQFASNYGLILGVFFTMFLLMNGIRHKQINQTINPGQGISLSLKNSFLVLVLSGLAVGLGVKVKYGLDIAVISGLLFGLSAYIAFGGSTVIRHYSLRLALVMNNCIAFHLIPFLDHCSGLIFLRRVGGGYIFIHRLLMEHFAETGYETGKISAIYQVAKLWQAKLEAWWKRF